MRRIFVSLLLLSALASNAATETIQAWGNPHFPQFRAKSSAENKVTEQCKALNGVIEPGTLGIMFCIYPSSTSPKSHCLASGKCTFPDQSDAR